MKRVVLDERDIDLLREAQRELNIILLSLARLGARQGDPGPLLTDFHDRFVVGFRLSAVRVLLDRIIGQLPEDYEDENDFLNRGSWPGEPLPFPRASRLGQYWGPYIDPDDVASDDGLVE